MNEERATRRWQARASIGWTLFGLSALWLLAVCYVSGLSLLPLVKNERYLDLTPSEIAIAAVIIIHPLLLGLLLRSAWRRRNPSPALLCASVPLITLALLIGWIILQPYLRERAFEEQMTRMTTGTITYNCARRSEYVDFRRETVSDYVLDIIEFRRPKARSGWVVQMVNGARYEADTFDFLTGSIGGSEAIRWIDAQGRPMAAALSFSDIIGEYGPMTIWMSAKQGKEPPSGEDPKAMYLTCGPDEKTYRETY